MFRSLRKAAESLEKSFEVVFASGSEYNEGRLIHVDGLTLRLGKVFAEGGFSFVHSAEPVAGPSLQRFAVKRMAIGEEDSLLRVRKEADLLAALPAHPNIVRYFGSSFTQQDAFLVFEMVDGGSLADRLNYRKSPLPPEDALNILSDIAAAVAHLHSQSPQPIACRDLKLENLLYDRLEKRYKLCDFGSCTTVAKIFENTREILIAEDEIKQHSSAPYRSPELVDLYAKQFVGEKTDVWSMGCVWYAILYGRLPFDGQSTLPILEGRYAVPSSPSYPEPFRKLLQSMLTVSVSQRADAFLILEATLRLRGLSIDPELKQLGADLRQKRQLQFSPPASSHSISSNKSYDDMHHFPGPGILDRAGLMYPLHSDCSASALQTQDRLWTNSTRSASLTQNNSIARQADGDNGSNLNWREMQSRLRNQGEYKHLSNEQGLLKRHNESELRLYDDACGKSATLYNQGGGTVANSVALTPTEFFMNSAISALPPSGNGVAHNNANDVKEEDWAAFESASSQYKDLKPPGLIKMSGKPHLTDWSSSLEHVDKHYFISTLSESTSGGNVQSNDSLGHIPVQDRPNGSAKDGTYPDYSSFADLLPPEFRGGKRA